MKPKITVENIVESVTYKDSTRTEHRRKANLEKSKAREILREAEGAKELHGPGLVKVDKRTKAYRENLVAT